MLHELRMGNLALVEELSLSLQTGLTIITGETGAGKSLIAGGLAILSGGKADSQIIRQGEELAYVEGVFEIPAGSTLAAEIRSMGIQVADDGLLVLRRELRKMGRGRVLINGLVSSLALLQRLGPRLLSVQSQDQQRLLSLPGFSRDFLDQALQLDQEKLAVGQFRAELMDLQGHLSYRRQEAEFARQQVQMWEYQARELEEAGLDPDEEARLGEQIGLGRNSRSLLDNAAKARLALTEGEVNARQLLASAVANLLPVADHSQRLQEILDLLQEAVSATEEGASELEKFLDSVDVDPNQLDELEARHSLYAQLQRKYDRDTAGLIELLTDTKEKLERQTTADADIAELEAQVENVRSKLGQAAQVLHEKRLAGCAQVARKAQQLITPLALPDLELEFQVQLMAQPEGIASISGTRCDVALHGADEVTLLVRTNRGEAYGPVGKIASGGEKSRIYLGLSVLSEQFEDPPLLLFDEIDAGLGMDNAVPVAGLLARLANEGQVLCITHLPTVAAHGRQHLKVAKASANQRTSVSVRAINDGDRVQEIARLLGGRKSGKETQVSQLDYARKLLAVPHSGEQECG